MNKMRLLQIRFCKKLLDNSFFKRCSEKDIYEKLKNKMRLSQILSFVSNFVVILFFNSSWMSLSTTSLKKKMPKNFLQKRICDSPKITTKFEAKDKIYNSLKIKGLYFGICLFCISCVPSLPQQNNSPNENISIPEKFQEIAEKDNYEEFNKNWQIFIKDKYLKNLIDEALKANQEIRMLEQDINIAKNLVTARQGLYLPQSNIFGKYSKERFSKNTNESNIEEALKLPKNSNIYGVGLSSSWEVDIWGKLRNSAKSSYYEFLASVEARNFAITQLVAEIADNYYELLALDSKLDIVTQYIQTLKRAQEAVNLQQLAGRTTSLAVKRFDAETLKNESHQYQIQQEIITVENKLNNLLGRLPQKIERNSSGFLDTKILNIATGIPADLLENRPDIRRVVAKLNAAKLNVKSVKKQFFPSLTIEGNIGYRAFNFNHLAQSPQNIFYNIAGNITAPILNRKAIKAEYFSANNEQIKAILLYEQTFIKAFTEVLNQILYAKNLKEMYNLKVKQTNALSSSIEISDMLFNFARIDYLDLLMTKRDFLDVKMELIEIKKQQISVAVNLYKVLGGGWEK